MTTGPDLLDLDIGPVAHGGHCVARFPDDDGRSRVVFVRHALPGERVRAQITERSKSFWRADAVEVVDNPSPDRVPSAWPAAGPGGVGGGELAHVSLPGQRRWKAVVIAEQFERLARIDLAALFPSFVVDPTDPDEARGGLHYRTRIDLLADADGTAGMTRFRSHDVVPLSDMPLATDAALDLADREVWARAFAPGARLSIVAPAWGSEPVLLVNGKTTEGDLRVTETVVVPDRGSFTYSLSARGFWQVHDAAPAVLIGAVMAAVNPSPGAKVADLFCGAGLFSVPLAASGAAVMGIEGNKHAADDAIRNLQRFRAARVVKGDVGQVLGRRRARFDAVVLDPPRVGAGRAVIDQIAATGASRVVYVACDPAALARDTAYLADHGFALAALRAFDLFPMTHHVESVATFER